jgi:hypothetical protein
MITKNVEFLWFLQEMAKLIFSGIKAVTQPHRSHTKENAYRMLYMRGYETRSFILSKKVL